MIGLSPLDRLASRVRTVEVHRDVCLSSRDPARAELARSDAEMAAAEAVALASGIRASLPLSIESRRASELADQALSMAQECRDHQHARAYRAERSAQ